MRLNIFIFIFSSLASFILFYTNKKSHSKYIIFCKMSRNGNHSHFILVCVALACLSLIALSSANQLLKIGMPRSNKKYLYGNVLTINNDPGTYRALQKNMILEKERKKVENELRKQHEKEADFIRKYLGTSPQSTSFLQDFYSMRF